MRFEQLKRLAHQAVDTEPTTTQALDDKCASAAFRPIHRYELPLRGP